MSESWLLLGAPGVGKSTFSFELKNSCENVNRFSVRLHTEKILEKKNELARFLIDNQIVQPKKHMPDFVVEQIFEDFLQSVGESDFLLIEGFPINDAQFRGMMRQLKKYNRKIDGVLILEDSYDAILNRIVNRRVCIACEKSAGGGIPISASMDRCPFCGGTLTKRPEDDIDFFKVRYEMYLEEKKRICSWFDQTMIHEVDVSSDEIDTLREEWKRRNESNG